MSGGWRQVKETVGATDIAEANIRRSAQAGRRHTSVRPHASAYLCRSPVVRRFHCRQVQGPRLGRQQIRPKAAAPSVAPLSNVDADARTRWRILASERVHGGEADLVRGAAETVCEQQPAILGEAREQFATHCDDERFPEVGNQILQERPGVRGMADGRRHNERHAAASAQEAGGHHEEGCP